MATLDCIRVVGRGNRLPKEERYTVVASVASQSDWGFADGTARTKTVPLKSDSDMVTFIRYNDALVRGFKAYRVMGSTGNRYT
jgi:hypothetical protein